jgi:hypothetical protein
MTDQPHPSKDLRIDDARLIFRNFSGMERPFNSEGDRNFSVVLEPLLAQELIAEGWRVKQLKPRQDEEEGDYHLKVKVNYKKGRPPRCVVITSNNRVEWGEDEIGMLDAADIKTVDIMVNGWWSDMAGGGYSGFLRSIFVTLHEDELELKYADLLAQNPNERAEVAPDEPSPDDEV